MFAGGKPAGAERRSGHFGSWKTFPEMCAKMKKESDFVETVSGDREVTFATDRTVIAVDWQTYDEVARLLEEAIGEAGYYNGSVMVKRPAFEGTLTATLIVYRTGVRLAGEGVPPISDVVPVWWEFETVNTEGDEVLNDFAFQPLRRALLARG